MRNIITETTLQLFATTQTTLMGTQSEGAYVAGGANNDLTAEMKTYYDMTLIDEASANLVHDQFGQKRPIPQGGGKTIEFRRFSSLPKATSPITEGVTPSGNSLNVSTVTSTVSQYGDFIVQSDVLELTAIDNTILEATKILGRQAGATLDTVVRNVINSGTNVSFSSKVSGGSLSAVNARSSLDDTAVLTVDDIQKAVAKLRGQNAPTVGGDYIAIIHPYVAYHLMRDKDWIDANKYGCPENLYRGEIGKLFGVRFVQSTEAKVWNDSTCPVKTAATDSAPAVYHSVFSTLVFGDGAYGVTDVNGGGLETIIKQKGSAGTADPLDQRSSVGWKALKTAELLVPEYLVRIESCCAAFDATPAN